MQIYVLESVTWPCGDFNSHALAHATNPDTLKAFHASESVTLDKLKGIVLRIPLSLIDDDDDVICNYYDNELEYCVIRPIKVMDEPEPELTQPNSVFLVQSYDLEAYNSPMETLGVANSAAEAEAMALRYIEQSQYGRIKLVPRTLLNEYHSGFNHLLYIEEVQMNSLLSQPN